MPSPSCRTRAPRAGRRRALAPLFLLFAALGCSGPAAEGSRDGAAADAAGAGAAVRVRLENATGRDLDRVLVKFPDEAVRYEAIADGARSEYASVGSAFRYAFLEAWHGDELYRLQPFDFVGERLLEPGAYTYVLSLDLLPDPPEDGALRGMLGVVLVEDS